ncbi:MAG: ribosome maturation factor RimM [Pseudomonadota bacterium]
MSDRICVGAIIGAFGTAGEVRLKSFCAEPADIAAYGALSTEDGSRLELRLTRPVKGGFAARVGGVRYRDQAEALRGTRLYLGREQLPNLPDDEFYYSDLIGLAVVDTGGAAVGRVAAVQDYGAGDILEIAPSGGGAAVLLPFTADTVPTVDLDAGRIVIDPPEGAMP